MSKKSDTLLRLTNVYKEYKDHEGRPILSLNDVSLRIKKGEFVSIMGASGSGKSTMMNIMGLLAPPSNGLVKLLGIRCENLDDQQLTTMRRRFVGFIFQDYLLIEHMSALENVKLALHCHPLKAKRIHTLAQGLLEDLGLGNHIHKRPNQLSGGQKQRVAIARALIKKPKLILADEPAGALDGESRVSVLSLLQKLNKEGTTVVMVTHNSQDAKVGTRLITIADAKIDSDEELTPDVLMSQTITS